jgi:hypothetical protein
MEYQPFDAVNYRQSTIEPGGRVSQAAEYSISGTRVENKIVLTVRILESIYNGQRRIGVGAIPSDYDTRIIIDEQGKIIDATSKSLRGLSSTDDPGFREMLQGFLMWVIPIYVQYPVSPGQIAAVTVSINIPNGRAHFTMVMAGETDYHGIRAVRLNFDQFVFEQIFRPGVPGFYPERGYVIVNPTNGVVLSMRWFSADGGGVSIETM